MAQQRVKINQVEPLIADYVIDFDDAVEIRVPTKHSVKVTTTGPITLSGLQTVDGIALIAGDRILVKNQGTLSTNGIYVVASTTWARASDMDETAKVSSGSQVFVELGTVNAKQVWILTSPNPLTLDVSDLLYEQTSGGTSSGFDVLDEGSSVLSGVTKLNFVGSNVIATSTGGSPEGNDVTITISDASGPADALNSLTTAVDVSGADAPTNGQVLTATSGTAATWQDSAGGGVTVQDEGIDVLIGVTNFNFVGNNIVVNSTGGSPLNDDVTITVNDFTYTNAVPMPAALGGFGAGETFSASTLEEMFDGLLYPYVAPTVSLVVSPTNSLREFGDDVSNPLLTATPVAGSDTISTIEFKRETTSLQIDATDTTYQEGISPVYTVDTNTTYWVYVDDLTTIASASRTYSFVYPYYYGVGAPGLTAAQVAGLTKLIQNNGDKTLAFTPSSEVYYFAYPASYGTLNNIYDWNEFAITSDFTLRVENITGLDATAQSYNIYEFNNLVTHSAENLRFDT